MRLTRVFLDQDMRCGFDGFQQVLAKAKVNPSDSTYILFMNRRGTMFKLLAGDNKYLVQYRSPQGRIPLDALRYLPQTFGGTKFEMNEAVKKSLLEKMRPMSARRLKGAKTIDLQPDA